MNYKRFLLFLAGLLVFVLLYTASAYSAANSIPPSNIKMTAVAKDPNQFLPPECASITVNDIVTNSVNNNDRANHLILGGPGNDTLNGGAGDDCIVGGAGDDTIDAGKGNNIILGGPGNDAIDGGNNRSYSTCYGGGSTPPGQDTFKQCDVIR